MPGAVVRRKEGGWEIRSPIRSSVLEEHFAAILETVGPHWESVAAAALTGTAELSVALFVFRGQQPTVALSAKSIATLAKLGATVDVDVLTFRPTD